MKKIIFILVLTVFSLSACGTPATPVPPTVTATPLSPAETLTSVPPTATVAPAPTTSSAQGASPKVGHWEGEPSVSFDVTSNGKVVNFQMEYPLGSTGYCRFTIEEMAIEEDNTFVFTGLVSPTELSPVVVPIITTISGEPEIIKTDTGDMIVLQRIIGKFENVDTLTGTGKIWMCEGTAVEGLSKGIEWNAGWKTP